MVFNGVNSSQECQGIYFDVLCIICISHFNKGAFVGLKLVTI